MVVMEEGGEGPVRPHWCGTGSSEHSCGPTGASSEAALAPSTRSSIPGSAWLLFRSSCHIFLSLPEAGRDLADESPSSRPSARMGTALVLPGQAGVRPRGTCSTGRWGSLSSGEGALGARSRPRGAPQQGRALL